MLLCSTLCWGLLVTHQRLSRQVCSFSCDQGNSVLRYNWHCSSAAVSDTVSEILLYALHIITKNDAQSIKKFPWRKWWATGVPTFDLQCSEIHSFVHPWTPGRHNIQIIAGVENMFLHIHEQFSDAKLIKKQFGGCFGCSGGSCSFQVKDCSAPDSHLGAYEVSYQYILHTT